MRTAGKAAEMTDRRRERRRELGSFLRAGRKRTPTADVELPGSPRRRTPGLRREELATLAGISSTCCTVLEQSRDVRRTRRSTCCREVVERPGTFVLPNLGATQPSTSTRPCVGRTLSAMWSVPNGCMRCPGPYWSSHRQRGLSHQLPPSSCPSRTTPPHEHLLEPAVIAPESSSAIVVSVTITFSRYALRAARLNRMWTVFFQPGSWSDPWVNHRGRSAMALPALSVAFDLGTARHNGPDPPVH